MGHGRFGVFECYRSVTDDYSAPEDVTTQTTKAGIGRSVRKGISLQTLFVAAISRPQDPSLVTGQPIHRTEPFRTHEQPGNRLLQQCRAVGPCCLTLSKAPMLPA